MIPYIVYAPPYHTGSGGIVVMHRLMQELKKHAPVFTNQVVQNKKWEYIPVADRMEDAIAVYPEIVTGNPFGSKKVVRYILNTPGFFGGPLLYDDTDIMFVYSQYWNKQTGLDLPEDRILHIPDLKEDEWPNRKLPRIYNLWYRGKGKQQEMSEITNNAIFMGNSQDMTEERQDLLRSVLERCHTLFTYDVVTAMIPIAIFSGCAVTVVEDPEKEVCFPRNMTEEKLRSMYREDEALVEEQIKTFIRITQNV